MVNGVCWLVLWFAHWKIQKTLNANNNNKHTKKCLSVAHWGFCALAGVTAKQQQYFEQALVAMLCFETDVVSMRSSLLRFLGGTVDADMFNAATRTSAHKLLMLLDPPSVDAVEWPDFDELIGSRNTQPNA